MRTPKPHAMTLIEIIIAISVFAVGVLAVLQLVVNNIQTVDHVSKHMDATMLASQGLELMYELRNSNSYKEARWDCLSIDFNAEDGCIKNENLGRYAAHPEHVLMIAPVGPESNRYRSLDSLDRGRANDTTHRLYRHLTQDNITYFNHDDSGEITPYARYISLERLADYDPSVALKITSHVFIYQGSREPKEVTLSSIIGNIID